MAMHETLHFSIDGEWLTDLLRTWFWDENRPFEKCMTMVGSCMMGADDLMIRNVTTDILEYRKKFVGVNTFQLLDDEGPVRPITEKLALIQTRLNTKELRDDMAANFIKYVDKWATTKSIHPESLRCNGDPKTFEECKEYFASVENVFHKKIYLESRLNEPTACGLWLWNNIPLVYHIVYDLDIKAGSDDFWKEIYLAKKDDPDFKERTMRYEAWIRRQEERNQFLIKESTPDPEEDSEKVPFWSTEWFDVHYKKENDINYNVHPDDIDNWEGLIAPNGDFYSCSFGGHNIKAWYLMITHPELFNLPFKFTSESTGSERITALHENKIEAENALDFATKQGWCATRFLPTCGEYVTLPELPKKPTKQQINRIFDAMLKHDVHLDTTTFLED